MYKNTHQDPLLKQLRSFGLVLGAGFIIIFDALLPLLFGRQLVVWPLWVAGVLALLSFVFPLGLHPFYKFWMKLGVVLNWINTRIILAIVFYLLFSPIGLIWKVIGKDPLVRRYSNQESYRIKSSIRNTNDLENPY